MDVKCQENKLCTMKQLPVKRKIIKNLQKNDMTVRINNNRKEDQSFSLQSNVSWQRVTDATKKVCRLRLQGSRCSISWNSSALNVDAATPPSRRYLSTNKMPCPRWFESTTELWGKGGRGRDSSVHITMSRDVLMGNLNPIPSRNKTFLYTSQCPDRI
jgi:hypothetical protein